MRRIGTNVYKLELSIKNQNLETHHCSVHVHGPGVQQHVHLHPLVARLELLVAVLQRELDHIKL